MNTVGVSCHKLNILQLMLRLSLGEYRHSVAMAGGGGGRGARGTNDTSGRTAVCASGFTISDILRGRQCKTNSNIV